MHVGSAFGTVIALCGTYIAKGDGGSTRAYGWTGLAGSFGGLYAGHLLAQSQPYSLGDGTILAVTGALGLYIPPALAAAGAVDDKRVIAGLAAAGSLGGLWLGNRLTAKRDVGAGHALLIGLGTLSGELVGLGVSQLAAANKHDGRAALWAGSIGSAAGFAVSWWMLADDAPGSGSPIPVRVSLNPSALLPLPGAPPLPLITASADF